MFTGVVPGVHPCLYPAGLGFHGGGCCVNHVLYGGFGAALHSEEIRKRLGDILIAGLVLPHPKRDLDQTWAKRRALDQPRLRRGGMVAVQTPARLGHVGGDCCLRHIRDVRRVFVVNARHLQVAASAGCALLRSVPYLLLGPAADCVTLEAVLATAPSLRVFLAPFLLLLLVYLPLGDGLVAWRGVGGCRKISTPCRFWPCPALCLLAFLSRGQSLRLPVSVLSMPDHVPARTDPP